MVEQEHNNFVIVRMTGNLHKNGSWYDSPKSLLFFWDLNNIFLSPFEFPLHFEGAWVPYEAEKDSYFVQQYGLDTPALVDKSVLRIIMLNA